MLAELGDSVVCGDELILVGQHPDYGDIAILVASTLLVQECSGLESAAGGSRGQHNAHSYARPVSIREGPTRFIFQALCFLVFAGMRLCPLYLWFPLT